MTATAVEFAPQQVEAIDKITEWYRSGDSQVFRLFGYAGTGKTTLARHIVDQLGVTALFAAFTGKAAYVLRSKGCDGAQTIHSLIYQPVEKVRKRLEELQARLDVETDPDEREVLAQAIKVAYVFHRTDDMFQFFRSDKGQINPHYWSEKLSGGRSSVLEHSEDVAHQRVTECLNEYESDTYPHLLERFTQRVIPSRPTPPKEVRETVRDYDGDGAFAYADGTHELLRELERLGVTADTWEWDLRDWDWSFLWACHAIVWAIAQYDGVRRRPVTTVELAGVSR